MQTFFKGCASHCNPANGNAPILKVARATFKKEAVGVPRSTGPYYTIMHMSTHLEIHVYMYEGARFATGSFFFYILW